ncbi:MAG: hypothetical protein V7690_19595 [Shewanella sp.]|jgi:hypothetical protein|uniref:hypothetical protein n=1 Tax=Shewanella sp. TaxID=50422 RepID=UPI003001B16D
MSAIMLHLHDVGHMTLLRGLNRMGDRFELQKLLSLYYSKEEVIYVSSLLISWSSNSQEALNWLNKPIPAFEHMTAIEACEKGLSEHILTYLKQIENGGYA